MVKTPQPKLPQPCEWVWVAVAVAHMADNSVPCDIDGVYSDHILVFGDDFVPGSCDMNLYVYASCMSALVVVRSLVIFLQARQSQRRRIEEGQNSNRKYDSLYCYCLPQKLLAPVVQCVVLVLFTVLTCMNVANGTNGAALFIFM